MIKSEGRENVNDKLELESSFSYREIIMFIAEIYNCFFGQPELT
jgi:hypothetical protein